MAHPESNETVVERYAAASARDDHAEMRRLRHPDWSVDWPQSGERVTSSDAFESIVARYPGGHPSAEVSRLIGAQDRWVVTPGNTMLRVSGSGDFWWGAWLMTYPDGVTWHVLDLIEMRAGLVHHETVFWAPPLEAPAWRRPFVELPDSPAGHDPRT